MNILVPVDGSAYSLKAVEAACDLVKSQPPSSLILLAVALSVFDLEDEGHYIADKLVRHAKGALAVAKEKAEDLGLTPQTLITSGVSVAEEIVRVAKEEKADLIVIGSRGLAGKTRFFIGGTAAKVVAYSPCNVLVVKVPEEK